MVGSFLDFFICSYDTVENSFGIIHKLEKYFKGSCEQVSGLHFSFNCFLDISFAREISTGINGLSCCKDEWT